MVGQPKDSLRAAERVPAAFMGEDLVAPTAVEVTGRYERHHRREHHAIFDENI
jgi:hypothetical protein